MRNINATLIICGAIYIAQGFIFLVAPDRIVSLYGLEALNDSMAFLMTIIGSAFVAAGVWFIMTILNPIRNINAIKFAILWCSSVVISPLYGLWQGYVDLIRYGWEWLSTQFRGSFIPFLSQKQQIEDY